MSDSGGMCDHCDQVYLENGSFDVVWVDDGTSRICTSCYRIHEKRYPEQRGVSYH